MIRVCILAATAEIATETAEALAQSERLELVYAAAVDDLARIEWDVDIAVAIGLAPDDLRAIDVPVIAIGGGNLAQPPPGIHALLPLDSSMQTIEAAVLCAAHGLWVLTSEQRRRWLRDDTPEPESITAEHLTPREIEVLRALADGLANKDIAAALGISEHTAKFHVSQILAKLNAASRAEAVAAGIRRGLIPL